MIGVGFLTSSILRLNTAHKTSNKVVIAGQKPAIFPSTAARFGMNRRTDVKMMSSATRIRPTPSEDFDKARQDLSNKYHMDNFSKGQEPVEASAFPVSSSIGETRQEVKATYEQLQQLAVRLRNQPKEQEMPYLDSFNDHCREMRDRIE